MLKNLFRKKQLGDKVDVLVKHSGRHKVMVIDVVRNITGMGLDDATHFVAKTPSVIKSGVPIAEAESIKSQLEAVGATVVFK